jgi:hypothetical protein
VKWDDIYRHEKIKEKQQQLLLTYQQHYNLLSHDATFNHNK